MSFTSILKNISSSWVQKIFTYRKSASYIVSNKFPTYGLQNVFEISFTHCVILYRLAFVLSYSLTFRIQIVGQQLSMLLHIGDPANKWRILLQLNRNMEDLGANSVSIQLPTINGDSGLYSLSRSEYGQSNAHSNL